MTETPTTKLSKVILIDYCYFMFRAIFCFERNRTVQPTWNAVSMILSNLKKVDVQPDDTVILAVDSKLGSWRKEVDPQYKANRKESREKHDIDWKKMWQMFGDLKEALEASTPFHLIEIEKLEADDIIAYTCKKFQDRECVIVSVDSDYDMLTAYPNVKFFSPLRKLYKHIDNPYKILASKIQKETADNLLTEVHTELEFERRNKIVNLLELPQFVEEKVEEAINFLPEKEWDINAFPFRSLIKRVNTLYQGDKVIKYSKIKRKKKKK